MTAYYNEIDPKATAWLRELIKQGHIAKGEVDERSILEVDPLDLSRFTQCHFFAGIGVWSYALRRAGWSDNRPVWTGSCPCQPFSAAGKGDEFADERHLWPAWFRLIRECKPVAVFGEQVVSKDALSWLDHVSTDLEAEGYAVGAVDTCAAGFGAPHIRQRLYFVAESKLGVGNHARQAGEQGRIAVVGRSAGIRQDDRQTVRSGDIAAGGAGELADANGRDASPEREQRSGEQRLLAQGGGSGSAAADSANPRRPGAREHDGGQPQLSARPVEHGDMGNASGQGSQACEPENLRGTRRREEGRAAMQPGTAGSLGNSDSEGPPEQRRERGEREQTRGERSAQAGPTNGFWASAEWIPCRDGKVRPTEPGTFPLVTGAPARVVRLRGYGNAINAEQARNFIEAYREVTA